MTIEYKRLLKMELEKGQTAFLWGARKTGKSFYLAKYYPDSLYYNLLKTDVYIRLLKEPHLLREEVLALDKETLSKPIIIDEVQKIPMLLDEVHYLIENSSAYFILCGSSARKLKIEGANLLGGRAWRYEFYPLVYPEVPDFDLLRALNYGLIPSHYAASNWQKTIRSFINDYLIEEIKGEGLTRNLRAFSEFLDVSSFSNGELINYSNIASECAIDSKTIKEYYQILVDTLLGYYLYPFKNKKNRADLVATPKFYFFDVGLVSGLQKRKIEQLKGAEAGKALEQYIFLELIAYRGIKELDFDITFFRTKSGQEVDFILNKGEIAIEIKIKDTIKPADLRGLTAFHERYKPRRSLLINTSPNKRKLEISDTFSIDVLPWETFLQMLWAGEII